MNKVILTGNSLKLEDVIAVSRYYAPVEISEENKVLVNESRKIVDDIVKEKKAVYGVTTGFGSLCNVSISEEETSQLQENLIRTHSCGYGNPLKEDEVRALMLIRINSSVKGFSGIRLSTVDTLLNMLNKNVIPFIPEKGSVGASGDLAPLSHMVLPMIGLGKAYYKGELLEGKEAMAKAGIPVIKLSAKEGLALINGTTVLTAIGSLATYDAINLLKLSDIAGALSLEAQRGIIDAFYEELHIIRPHKGCLATAKNIRELLQDSTYITHTGDLRMQDAYSLRCIPQVHGASKDAIAFIKEKVEIEINAATDNPIILPNGQVISGGNFHGQPMAQPFDYLGIASSEIGNISERRLERLLNHALSKDLPSFLVKNPGLDSGFMITQYAAAALVSENKVLAHPASVDSIPTCENQEDIVSMGTIAARKARDIVNNSLRCVSTEIMAACQAIDFRKTEGFKFGKGTAVAYNEFRKYVKFIEDDKDIQMYDELEKATNCVKNPEFLKNVEEFIKLNIQ